MINSFLLASKRHAVFGGGTMLVNEIRAHFTHLTIVAVYYMYRTKWVPGIINNASHSKYKTFQFRIISGKNFYINLSSTNRQGPFYIYVGALSSFDIRL